MRKLIIAIIVVLIIILSFGLAFLVDSGSPWGHQNYWRAQFVDDPWTIYQQSDGTYDIAAQLALDRLQHQRVVTPADHALSAAILTRNIINGGNDRLELIENARQHYIAALEDLLANIPLLPFGEGYIIDNAIIFAMDHNGIIELPELAQQRHQDLVDTRRAAAADRNDTKIGTTEDYLNMAIEHTNDSQNTHDKGVLHCIEEIINRLRQEQESLKLPSLNIIKSDIIDNGVKLSDGRAHKVQDVIAVIDMASQGHKIHSMDLTDMECLQRIWLRIYDENNTSNQKELLQSFFDVLYDCWETGIDGRHIVCVNGRVSRILSTLSLLDYDERNWEIKKLEQYKNDIYEKTLEIINGIAAAAAGQSADVDLSRAGKLYLAKSTDEIKAIGEVSEAASAKLTKKMRSAIKKMVHATSGGIPDYMINTVLEDAYAAIA